MVVVIGGPPSLRSIAEAGVSGRNARASSTSERSGKARESQSPAPSLFFWEEPPCEVRRRSSGIRTYSPQRRTTQQRRLLLLSQVRANCFPTDQVSPEPRDWMSGSRL